MPDACPRGSSEVLLFTGGPTRQLLGPWISQHGGPQKPGHHQGPAPCENTRDACHSCSSRAGPPPLGSTPLWLRPPPRLLNWSSELTTTQRGENTPTRSFSAETTATTPVQGPRDKPPQARAGERHRDGHLGNLSRQQVPRHLTLWATPETKAGLPACPWPGAPALRRGKHGPGSRASWTPRSVRASDEVKDRRAARKGGATCPDPERAFCTRPDSAAAFRDRRVACLPHKGLNGAAQ